jgi:hypothetical protein
MICLLPFMMVLYADWFVWRHILPYRGRRAAWVLNEDPEGREEVMPRPFNLFLRCKMGGKSATNRAGGG